MSQRRTALVLGETGQLARELVRTGPDENWTIECLGRSVADFTRPDTVLEAIAARDPEVVINAVAYTAVDQAEQEPETAELVNSVTPGRVAAACADRALPFIHVSTDYVFAGNKTGAYTERDETGPRSVYGATKLAGETAIMAAGGAPLIARTSWVYSAFGKNFLKTMLRVGAERDELAVVDDQIGCPTHAGDLATGLLRAGRSLIAAPEASGIYHLAGPDCVSWAEFAERIFRQSAETGGSQPHIRRIATSEYPTPATRPANSQLDSQLFVTAFGYECRSLDTGIRRTLADLAAVSG